MGSGGVDSLLESFGGVESMVLLEWGVLVVVRVIESVRMTSRPAIIYYTFCYLLYTIYTLEFILYTIDDILYTWSIYII